jgi:hypothetical protein
MIGVDGIHGVPIWVFVTGGKRCRSLTKPKQAAGGRPPLLFVKASGADRGGGAWLWR